MHGSDSKTLLKYLEDAHQFTIMKFSRRTLLMPYIDKEVPAEDYVLFDIMKKLISSKT